MNRKGLVRSTRKGLIDVLDSSLDLSSYALFARKSILCLPLFRELGTWFGYCVDGQSICHL
uniref:Uncharacterized protein n=1 Tax=Medicago truncatula TaxID=3880 RepID=A2Q341_MEDTR|nr:hypothetical protein MtrDRAFT_AC154391g26v2 [Medicago truncatula]